MSTARVFADQEKIANYRILHLASAGGMGEVYEAWDEELQRRVALKVLNEELAADPEHLANFKEEGRALARLHHKNVVTVHTLGQHAGRHFIAMEFVNGSNLHRYINEKNLDVRSALQLMIQALEGLRVAHEAGIIHRDLKPQNIMVHTNGTVKLVDFGLAKIQITTMSVAGPMRQNWGTKEYTAPEVLLGHPATKPSDIFAMGKVLKAVLHGNLAAHPEIAALIARMTSVLPPSRPNTVHEVIVALNRILGSTASLNEVSAPAPLMIEEETVPILENPELTPRQGYHRVPAVLIFFAAIGAVGYGLWKLSPEFKRFSYLREAPKIESKLDLPEPRAGSKFTFLYKLESEDGGFVNEILREWKIESVETDKVTFVGRNGQREVYSRNLFLPPREVRKSPLRPFNSIEYRSDPHKGFPLHAEEQANFVISETSDGHELIYNWNCRLVGRETTVISAGTFETMVVVCAATGGRVGTETFKYAPQLHQWVARERSGFGLPFLSAELTAFELGP